MERACVQPARRLLCNRRRAGRSWQCPGDATAAPAGQHPDHPGNATGGRAAASPAGRDADPGARDHGYRHAHDGRDRHCRARDGLHDQHTGGCASSVDGNASGDDLTDHAGGGLADHAAESADGNADHPALVGGAGPPPAPAGAPPPPPPPTPTQAPPPSPTQAPPPINSLPRTGRFADMPLRVAGQRAGYATAWFLVLSVILALALMGGTVLTSARRKNARRGDVKGGQA